MALAATAAGSWRRDAGLVGPGRRAQQGGGLEARQGRLVIRLGPCLPEGAGRFGGLRHGRRGPLMGEVRVRRRQGGLRQIGYEGASLCGAVRPATGQGVALVLPEVSTAAMQVSLDRFAASLAANTHAVLVLDQAGWLGS
ncbi:MAG: hypothetical protein QJR07_14465, partial [Acetobacteraceae bacterium]|nr:hypothetical protein [Acetobacteraceae bacterium]